MKRSVKKLLTFLVVGTVLLATTAPVLAVELTKDIDTDLFPTIDLIDIGEYLFPTIELEPLFCWDNIPGNDSELLLKFLMDEFEITWTENATICKYNNNTIINISTDEHSVEIIMDETEEEVTIKIDDGRTYYIEVKKQDGKLNIFAGFGPARIWYVDDDGGADFTRIQDAINNASYGDMIIVRDGTYTENIKIKIPLFSNLNLKIRSENGPDFTTVRALNSNDHVFVVSGYEYYRCKKQPCLFLEAIIEVDISGFTIKGAYNGAGIYIHSADHCTISNNNFSSNSIGIKLKNSDGNLITHNNAMFNNDSGLEMDYNWLDNKVYLNNFDLNNFDVPSLTLLSTPQITFSLNRMDANKYMYYKRHVPYRVEDFNYSVYGFVTNEGGAGNVAIVASTSPLEHILSGLCVREFKIDEGSQYRIEITGEMHEQSVYFRPHSEYTLIIDSPSATSSAEWPLGKAYFVEVFDIKLMPFNLSSTNQNYQYHGRNYTGYLGNYWVGYDGVDEDGNGIGDTSYRIISGGIDNYPLMEPFENYRIEE